MIPVLVKPAKYGLVGKTSGSTTVGNARLYFYPEEDIFLMIRATDTFDKNDYNPAPCFAKIFS